MLFVVLTVIAGNAFFGMTEGWPWFSVLGVALGAGGIVLAFSLALLDRELDRRGR